MVEDILRWNKNNQLAGHLEENKTVVDAVIREVKEETDWCFYQSFLLAFTNYFLILPLFRFNFYGELIAK